MPTARDLLQQADALMRSHRNLGHATGAETVPVLTDVAIPGNLAIATRQHEDDDIPVLTSVVEDVAAPEFDLPFPNETIARRPERPPDAPHVLLLPVSEMPKMPPLDEASRGADEQHDERAALRAPIDSERAPDEMPKWLEADFLETGRAFRLAEEAPDYEASRANGTGVEASAGHGAELSWESMPMPSVDALSTWREADDPPIRANDDVTADTALPPLPDESSAETVDQSSAVQFEDVESAARSSHPAAPAEVVDKNDHFDALPAHDEAPPEIAAEQGPSAEEIAETVYFQVLQNLDLVTERALQQHLSAHLQPILERATRELLETVNANLGALMRQFVADAIEKQLGVRPVASASSTNA